MEERENENQPQEPKPFNEPPPRKATRREIEAEIQKEKRGIMAERQPSGQQFDYKRVAIVAVVASFVVVFIMNMLGMVGITKEVFDKNFVNVSKTIDEIKANNETSQTSLNNAIKGIPKQISDTMSSVLNQINTSITTLTNNMNGIRDDVDAIKNAKSNDTVNIATNQAGIVALEAKVKTMQDNMTVLQKELNDAQSRIDDLEDNPGTSSKATDEISIEIGDVGEIEFDNALSGVSYIEILVYNETNETLELDDLEFNIWMHPAALPVGLDLSYTKLSYGSYNITHDLLSYGSGVWEYDVRLSNINMEIRAGKSKKIAMPFEVKFATAKTLRVYVYPELELTDYDLD